MRPAGGPLRWLGIFALTSVAAAPAIGANRIVPTVASIQIAYESAKAEAKERHDDQLLIREADCRQSRPGNYTCQIGFTDERSTNGRLYFDVIGLDRTPLGWKLVSGLCQR